MQEDIAVSDSDACTDVQNLYKSNWGSLGGNKITPFST